MKEQFTLWIYKIFWQSAIILFVWNRLKERIL